MESDLATKKKRPAGKARRKRPKRAVRGAPAGASRYDASAALRDMRNEWAQSRRELRVSSRLGFKWFGIAWLCYATPLWLFVLADWVVPKDQQPRLVRFVVLMAITLTFLSVLLTLFSAARALVAQDAEAAK